MKRVVSSLLIVMILAFSMPALAAETNALTPQDPVIEPNYVGLQTVTAGLSISNGVATCKGSAKARYTNYSLDLTMQLQKKTGTTWSKVSEWTGSGVGVLGVSLNKTKSGLTSGSYRVKVTVKVYNASGSLIETPTIYSSIKTI